MKILVTGANGQLGRELMEQITARGWQGHGTDRDTLDIADLSQCLRTLGRLQPDAVIHAAAYTAVDLAEQQPDEAYRINTLGTRNIAAAAAATGAKCCIVSTDYVFDGTKAEPYREYDRTNPQTVYGLTKLAGEQLAASLNPRWYVVRTAWLYGKHGSNFVNTMLKLAEKQSPLSVVHDQRGCPTNAADLAAFLLELVATEYYGIYHAVNAGECSWYELAASIFAEKGLPVDLRPCTTEQFPRPAKRPAYSVLDSLAIRTNGFKPLRPWQEALKDYLRNA
ncbi:MAG: dTDP-4-dehydrorhamnose reductase [Paenibacillaceae bacterium]|jgi:dTDP-4-dehydrorhamnose reductase|nr:dTDP-4-dehydrorhamnose reductase [Paenibacillaceae bacterium]